MIFSIHQKVCIKSIMNKNNTIKPYSTSLYRNKPVQAGFFKKLKGSIFTMEAIKPVITDIPSIMTRKDLQEILQISKNTALELLQTEQIDSFMVKGRYRITREALMQFIEYSYLCKST